MRGVVLLFIALSLFAQEVDRLIELYKQKQYQQACSLGTKIFRKIQRNEDLVTTYAFACLYSDNINRLYVPSMVLRKSKSARHNRAYFTLIIAQKNILLASLFDGETYDGLNVPNTDYILSRVFNLYFQKRYTKKGDKYFMEDSHGRYALYVTIENGKKWLNIEELDKNIIHKYR